MKFEIPDKIIDLAAWAILTFATCSLAIVFSFSLLACILSLVGCSNAQVKPANQILDPATLYRRDMIITVNGVTKEGVVSAPLLASNTIHVVSPGNLDLLTIQNCSGEQVKPKEWNVTTTVRSGLFGWDTKTISLPKEAQFTFSPSGLELGSACPLELIGESKDGVHAWGMVDWKTKDFTLTGSMVCNSLESDFNGVEICQSRKGLYQSLTFKEVVFMEPDAGCELDKKSGTDFTFQMPGKQCVYRIKGKETGAVGKLTLIGYTDILVRPNP